MSSIALVGSCSSGCGGSWASEAWSAGAGDSSRAAISEGLIRTVVRAAISFSFCVFRTSVFRERMSAMVLMDPGQYVIFKWKSASWSAHRACLGFSSHLVVKYSSVQWSVIVRKGVFCKLISRGLHSARPRMTASISLSWIS